MPGENHTIGKCIFELAFASETSAFEVQKKIPGCLGADFYDSLDEIFNSYSTQGETIAIDHIGIDLGEIPISRFTGEIKDRLLSGLKREVGRIRSTGTPERGGRLVSRGQAPVLKMEPDELLVRILCHYLESGILPWWAGGLGLGEIETRILDPAFGGFDLLKVELQRLGDKSRAAERLARQFGREFNETLVRKMYSFDLEEMDISEGKRQGAEGRSKVEDISMKWQGAEGAGERQEEAGRRPWQEAAGRVWERILNSELPVINYQLPFAGHQVPVAGHQVPVTSHQLPVTSYQLPVTSYQSRIPDFGEGIFIDNAGMVILWPFLEQFFVKSGLVRDGTFINRESHEKALLISQFLVTGVEDAEEPAMVLNKLLTGWPMEESFDAGLIIPDNERDECEELLFSVIENWPVLKHTSPAGLRESFLIRPGKLTRQGENWLLQVERRGIDILLEQLPWPIGVVKFPWMNQILHVEW
jgi:hypothetical protein